MQIKLRTRLLITTFVLVAGLISTLASAESTASYRAYIQSMKQSEKGPFYQIRWFCKDGTIKPAKPYSCGPHGGGVQHGLLNSKAKKLRAAGYEVANLFAGINAARYLSQRDWRDKIGQVLVERFLINFDDGWIFRGARFYRGALQAEDEIEGARELLKTLMAKVSRESSANDQDFLLLREAYRLLPKKRKSATVNQVRSTTSRLADRDAGFLPIRTKIHNLPDSSDAERVRRYARTKSPAHLRNEYLRLAGQIDQIYRAGDTAAAIRKFARTLQKGDLKTRLLSDAGKLGTPDQHQLRLKISAGLLAELRESYPRFRTSFTRFGTLELSEQLEQESFKQANALARMASQANRNQAANWLESMGTAIYGTGLISKRQHDAFLNSIRKLSQPHIPLAQYRSQLRYLNRLPGWANHWLRFHFAQAINRFSKIEPLANQFIPDRLRANPLLGFGKLLDALLIDANALSGLEHSLFGQTVGAGIRMLNPGIARGVLRTKLSGRALPQPEDIVWIPETTAELAPVAGILTRGEGNALSHVQLLAGNLGIPNVVIDDQLGPLLESMEGKTIVLAVSPGGMIRMEADSAQWHDYFNQVTKRKSTQNTHSNPDAIPDTQIRPDLDKLSLNETRLLTLSDLRADQAGRVCGPKAANLGELKHHFPAAVTEGLVIPFGVFRSYLEQPYRDTGQSAFDWLRSQYAQLANLKGDARTEATSTLLSSLRNWIESTAPDATFQKQLKQRLLQVFGKDGSYAVFVRSDTNVEDLPGFTGAGLNLTVPNVRGYQAILDAILRVWASPFSERAFAWRQRRMTNPEHVYPSVLLLKSVAVDKSGVLLSVDTETGDTNKLTVAVNQGIGGAVQGQAAEELLIDSESGAVTLLSDATASQMKVLNPSGGLVKRQRAANGQVLTATEINKLVAMAKTLKEKFPQRDESGATTPADVEFGFKQGELVLFQVRPYLQNRQVRKNQYLISMDQGLKRNNTITVNMSEAPNS